MLYNHYRVLEFTNFQRSSQKYLSYLTYVFLGHTIHWFTVSPTVLFTYLESQNCLYIIPEAYVGDWEAAQGNEEEGEGGRGVP